MPESPVSVEQDDILPRRLVLAAGVLLTLIALAALSAWGLLRLWHLPPTATGPSAAEDFPLPAPRLQEAPQPEREGYFADKEALLHRLEWVDRRAGVARIPIDDAIGLLAGRGRTGPLSRETAP